MRKEVIGNATLINGDCMLGMADMVENQFDLAIVDPPYGIDIAKWDGRDNKPTAEYFNELFRISKEQIIWGANYFHLPHSQAWICWHKTAGFKKRALAGASDFELAWTSFDIKARFLPLTCSGNVIGFNGGKPDYTYKAIHPTQKPVALYSWLLKNYAKEGQTILDTHMGSGSSVIACLDAGHPITAYELDEEYFDAACRRIEEAQRQQKLF